MMTSAVFIHQKPPTRGPSHVSSASYGSSPAGSLPPFSPPSTLTHSGALGVAGASPPYRGGSSSAGGDKTNPYLAAKKFWKRLCFDPALDPTEYLIGFIETVQQPERKSGVEAWSMRLHDRLCELPYTLFVERFCGGGGGGGGGPLLPRESSPNAAWLNFSQSTSDEAASDVPYHRIAYFKHGNVVVWESEYHKRRLNDLSPATVSGSYDGGVCGGGGGGGVMQGGSDRSSRRSNSRDGMLTLPASSAGLLSLGSGFTPLAGINLDGAGAFTTSGRSPRGASPGASEDGLDGTVSDEDDLQLLLEEEEAADEEGTQEGTDVEAVAGGKEDVEEGAGRRGGMPLYPVTRVASSTGRGGSAAAAAVAAAAAAAAAATMDSAAAELPEAPPPLPQLPEECWMSMLQQQLGVRDVCMVGRTCRWLRQLAADPGVWRSQYCGLWGAYPDPGLGAAVVRRMCRRSQLRAARWLEAHVSSSAMGFPSTTCLQMDDSKVVSGDGNAVRLWEHATGRRIATLQGHPGRITSVAFDDSLLVSGCAGSVVKLWSMDDLRCRRTLRGHEGAVTSCCLLPTGIPVSGAEDGVMRLWDVTSGSAIVSLEAGGPVMAMQAHAPSGHLVSAAGWGVQIWDVSTATLLHTLGVPTDDDVLASAVAAAAAGGGLHATASVQHPYTCVSYMGELLAAGRHGEVVLLDLRVSGAVGRLVCATYGGGSRGSGGGAAAAADFGSIAAAAAAVGAGRSGGGGGRTAACVGVQMDEWKLVCGFNDGRHLLHVYDIRSLPKAGAAAAATTGGSSGGGGGGSLARRDWHEPLMSLKAPSRINTFQFHEQALLVGVEGSECIMWRFEDPTVCRTGTTVKSTLGSQSPVAAPGSGWGGGSGGGPGTGGGIGTSGMQGAEAGGFMDAGGSGRKEKKKPAKVAKKQTRYPKRNTK
ncbi:hypothetical protein Vretimale_9694 [Volvox reticuliferus]|uniref:F-box domain-containing protein n=1 Tax=Volvox reticuliferus TaxID=1737510 RepID=A0A8J4FQK9_9CHLO|nr:hypothetical protein Vretifemale_13444 [Volvox reticuliferus]GIM05247.1 hypothetical protein Vretimale_9694 [Volvox reticuliferus]